MHLGQKHAGTDLSPQLLQNLGLMDILRENKWEVTVSENLCDPSKYSSEPTDEDKLHNAKNCREIGLACQKIEKGVYEHAKTDNFLLMLGGDHSIPIGTIPAIKRARPNTGIVWVDAHADINTPSGSESGNIHGMPLGFLLGLVDNVNSLPSFDYFKPCLDPTDIVYIGLRDVDDFEKDTIRRLGIKAYSMYDIDKKGIGRVMEEVGEYMAGKDIHLSFDIDALDPLFAPSTGTAVRGGLTFREGNYICETLYETGRLKSMEMVEVNPMLNNQADAKQTAEMAIILIRAAMGRTIL
eukprot:CAMPEP_0185020966 /NCGR_PEP_ID=MMETSP1103-20130426/3615_1 /TAXON_ID=36769 /ORGANISM="Paraphysomonas bandaiensis, Strain Caron Lab Isolate" /LENGTH=295 /DNA_ID=CAMNT_0027552199 /DNA_START=156 /DNA_END=1043 /DNA_ORIENTATION=-